MLSILNNARELYPTLSIVGLQETVTAESAGDSNALAFRTDPQLDGNLHVDPEIHLPSPGMDVDIAYYYNANSSYNTFYGYGRTINVNLSLVASGTSPLVTFQRGNGTVDSYQSDAAGNLFAASPNNRNSLTTFVSGTDIFWKETTPDGRNAVYPVVPDNQISSIVYVEDSVGNRHNFSYGAVNQKFFRIQDTLGRRVTFNYVVSGSYNGMLESIRDWAERLTTFQYATVAGQTVLATVVGPSGCQTGYGYSNAGGVPLLDRISDPNGFTTTYAYDGSGRVYQRTVAGQYTTRYAYSTAQMVRTDPTGVVVTYTNYSPWYIAKSIDAKGVVTSVTRNAKAQEVMRQDTKGAIWTTVYDDIPVVAGVANYKPKGNPTSVIDPYGCTTTVAYDNYNNPTTIQYADGGVVAMLWGYSGSSFDTSGQKRRLQVYVDQLEQRTTYTYNGRGQLTTLRNALGQLTAYNYDSLGNLQSVVNPLGQRVTHAFDKAGNLISRTDPLGHMMQTGYDAQNRPVTITDALGYVTTLAYDGVGNLTVQIDALGNQTNATYNVFDKPETIEDALGFVNSFSYDGAGRLKGAQDPLGRIVTNLYDAAGRLSGVQDGLGRITTTSYDIVGRPQAMVDALGYRTTISYDLAGRPVTFMDAVGRISTTIYDKLGRSLANVDALGRRTTASYDLAGRPVTFIDALGFITTNAYDALGRVVASVDQLGYRSTTVYDLAGRLSATYDALGYRTSYLYDAAGRLISVQDPLELSGHQQLRRSESSDDGNVSPILYYELQLRCGWASSGRVESSW